MATIKRVRVDQLRPGMYVQDLNLPWLHHDFLRGKFLIKDPETIDRIAAQGISEVDIDLERGADVVTEEKHRNVATGPVDPRSLAEIRQDRANRSISLDEERRRASGIYNEATGTIEHLLDDARFGRQIEVERLEPVIDRMCDSIFRHSDALIPLAQLKHHHRYTFEHAVSTSALMVAFARNLGVDRHIIHGIATGAMLQDLGMAMLPTALVDKRAHMTQQEATLIRSHVEQSHILLGELGKLPDTAMEVIVQHHERLDGNGYPFNLAGEQISLYGQMAAIVDVYDAMTSPRPYRKAMPPTEALKKLFEWGKKDFNPRLVQAFIRTIGIYPVGSLVRLQSDWIGVVVEQTEVLLQPKVRIFFNARTRNFMNPETITIGKGAGAAHGPIVGHEAFETWNLDPARWIPS